MRPMTSVVRLALCGAVFCLAACSDGGGGSDAGPDTDTDADTDTDDGCAAGGNWYDPATELCWQNPPSTDEFTWDEAVTYCDDLSLGSHDDWRLPLIQELISLLRGCVDGTAAGDLSTSACGVSDPDCLGEACDDAACNYCDELAGPDDDPDGCYWDPALAGICYVYWSSSSYANDVSNAWFVGFDYGAVYYHDESTPDLSARCVRGGP